MKRPTLIHVDHEQGRVFVVGRRLHHGLTGCAFIGLGIVLAIHDWADRRDWLRGRGE